MRLRHLLALIPLSAVTWSAGAEAPLLAISAGLRAAVDASLTSMIAVQAMAAVIGGLAFFLPNSFGAHDGITVGLLACTVGMPIPVATGAALLVRMSDLLARVLVVAVLAVLERRRILPPE